MTRLANQIDTEDLVGTMGDVFVATMQRLADILNLEVSQLVEESLKYKERNGEEKGEELDE
ncbi:MAG: hypothetical protein M1830_005028 [Pleopsidium flavum]|nr:MAG: hypothetical protein M1830_005028 [Pleopsidium flavum]